MLGIREWGTDCAWELIDVYYVHVCSGVVAMLVSGYEKEKADEAIFFIGPTWSSPTVSLLYLCCHWVNMNWGTDRFVYLFNIF